MTSIITLEIDGLSQEQTRKYKEVIDILIINGIMNIRNGKAILNFDHEGVLQEIEVNLKKYRRKKDLH